MDELNAPLEPYVVQVKEALSTPPAAPILYAIEIDRARNAARCITAILSGRLESKQSSLKRIEGTSFYWNGGALNFRNIANQSGIWTALWLTVVNRLHEIAAEMPAVYVLTSWQTGSDFIRAYVVPEWVIFRCLPLLRVEKNNPGRKTIKIAEGASTFAGLENSPDLSRYFVRCPLLPHEVETLLDATKADADAKTDVDDDADLGNKEDDADDDRLPQFTAETVEYIKQLPQHMQDSEWHDATRDQFRRVLQTPMQALVERLRTDVVKPLSPEVGSGTKLISRLKKNDFGQGGYYAHYWFAFYDPAVRRKNSVQLYFSLKGISSSFDYGLAMGTEHREYSKRLAAAIKADRNVSRALFLGAPPGSVVLVDDKEYSATAFANLSDRYFLIADGETPRIQVLQRFPLDELPTRSKNLVRDIGTMYRWAWPLFQASQTGTLLVTPAPTQPVHEAEDNEEDLDLDEDAPATLDELVASTSLDRKFLEDLEDALLAKHQIVLTGPPGTSKTYVADLFARYFARGDAGRAQGLTNVVYVHANWGYEDFFEGLRPDEKAKTLLFHPTEGLFLKWILEEVSKTPPHSRNVMVLDELNRCDTASVMGELLQLFEYRGRTVQLLSGRPFVLPDNVYFIGTMNSADRSVGRLDLALRRRFFWIDLLPDPDVLGRWLEIGNNNQCGFSANRLRVCNKRLSRRGIPPEQQIGHALFMGHSLDSKDEDAAQRTLPLTEKRLRQVVRYAVLPYVRELLLSNFGRVDTAFLDAMKATFMTGADDTGEAANVEDLSQ